MNKLYRLERWLCAVLLLAMGSIVFLDVVHRASTRVDVSPTTTILAWLVTALLVFGAFRLRGAEFSGATILRALASTLAIKGALTLFVLMFPNGLVWSQTLGLVLMLWVGCMGASMATHERRHLALDIGSKLWPKAVLPYVQAFGHVLTGGFCLVFAALSVVSVRTHFQEWSETAGAGGIFVALAIPKFLAFSIIPISFVVMALRFLLQAVASARGEVFEEDAMQMLGLDQDGSAKGEQS